MLQVKVENFEGPLDLLLKLIEKQEMDITKISLAQIADQYVEHIKASENIKPEEIGDFLVVAARLLFIKSKLLLPYFEWEEEEEEEELEQQLKIYKEFLEAGRKVEEIIKQRGFSYGPNLSSNKSYKSRALIPEQEVFCPPKNLKTEDVSRTFGQLIQSLKRSEALKERMQERKMDRKVTLEEKIRSLRKMISKRIRFSFDKLVHGSESKTDIIVSFLAVLELSKQKVIATEQKDLFSSIDIDPYN